MNSKPDFDPSINLLFPHVLKHPLDHASAEQSSAMNTDRSVVVKNMRPNQWPGRVYDFYLYKNNRPFMLETNVGVGCQAYFRLDPTIYFGVASNIMRGSVIKSLASLHSHFKVDLRNYSSGIVVSLHLDQASGRFMFSAIHNAENVGAPPLSAF